MIFVEGASRPSGRMMWASGARMMLAASTSSPHGPAPLCSNLQASALARRSICPEGTTESSDSTTSQPFRHIVPSISGATVDVAERPCDGGRKHEITTKTAPSASVLCIATYLPVRFKNHSSPSGPPTPDSQNLAHKQVGHQKSSALLGHQEFVAAEPCNPQQCWALFGVCPRSRRSATPLNAPSRRRAQRDHLLRITISITSQNRDILMNLEVVREAFGDSVFSPADVSVLLGVRQANNQVSRWKQQGLLERVGRGQYRISTRIPGPGRRQPPTSRREPPKQRLLAHLARRRWRHWIESGRVTPVGPRAFRISLERTEAPLVRIRRL